MLLYRGRDLTENNYLEILKDVPFENSFSFAKHTTYGCGGAAKIAYYPDTVKRGIAVYDFLTHGKIPFTVLGNGSDVLASDKGFDGAVIVTKSLKKIYKTNRNSLICQAGVTVSSLLKFCVQNGCGGLEYLAGIPATVGGLAYMNGGAGGIYICNNVIKVRLYDEKLRNFSNKRCNFGYKYSTMRGINSLILGVELSFTPENGEIIAQRVKEYLRRRAFHPKGKSCGCVFKNPAGASAGKIIEDAGLKGLKMGCAEVSERHANFIINRGENSADIYKLIEEVKRRVLAATGIALEEEVVYIGDFK